MRAGMRDLGVKMKSFIACRTVVLLVPSPERTSIILCELRHGPTCTASAVHLQYAGFILFIRRRRARDGVSMFSRRPRPRSDRQSFCMSVSMNNQQHGQTATGSTTHLLVSSSGQHRGLLSRLCYCISAISPTSTSVLRTGVLLLGRADESRGGLLLYRVGFTFLCFVSSWLYSIIFYSYFNISYLIILASCYHIAQFAMKTDVDWNISRINLDNSHTIK